MVLACCVDIGLSALTRGRVTGEPYISIDPENYILDWELGNGVVDHLNELLGELLDKAMPIFLRLTELGVVHYQRAQSACILWL